MTRSTVTGILPHLSRRQALAGLAASATIGRTRLAFGGTSGTGPRFVLINVRGGLDGIAAVVPYADPYLAGLRASLVPKNLLKLNSMWALDPNLPNLYAMFGTGQALAVHAVAPLGDTRSHFVSQDQLQSGSPQIQSTGWLNRAMGLLGYSGSLQPGLAVCTVAPPVITGGIVPAGWSSDPFHPTTSSLENVMQTDSSNDSQINPMMTVAFNDRDFFNAILQSQNNTGSGLPFLATAAGLCLASPYGPQVAVLQTDSVDTHYDQANRLPTSLSELDQAIAALQSALGSAVWSNTVVLTMTEFGRTAYENGTTGTDHGTGFAVFLAGGPVIGNQVVTPGGWYGLGQLWQGRDLWPTTDFRSVALTVLFNHLGIASSNQETIFPGSTAAGCAPIAGLISG